MSATKLFSAGFTDIVSVIPPGAKLSKNSQIKPAMLGKVPGIPKGKSFVGYPFTTYKPTEKDAAKWDKAGANVGLLGDRYPALDIDIEDEGLAQAVLGAARHRLGLAPTRLSREPRRLLPYRTTEPFGRISLVINYKGQHHLVEMLGQGRQYLVAGRHPSGVDYRWEGAAQLWDLEPGDLPLVTKDMVVEFFEEMALKLQERGIEVELLGTGRAAAEAPPQEDLKAPTMGALAELVSRIPNRLETRGEYLGMLYAIKAAGQDSPGDALVAALEWAGRWEDGYNDPEEVERTWDSLRGPYRVGWDWLQSQAEATVDGFSLAQEHFTTVEGVETPTAPPAPATGAGAGLIPHTDEWVVAHILNDVRDMVRFVPGAATGTWYVWAGHKWSTDAAMGFELLIRRHLTRFAQWLQARADAASAKEGKVWRDTATRVQSATGIRNAVSLLRAKVAISPGDFDVDPWTLNTPGGVINLRTGVRAPSGGMYARSTAVDPVEGPTPLWDRFMRDLTGGDADLITYIQKVAGYALTGDMAEKTLWFLWGSDADTGKSTFVRVLSEILGDYSDSVDVSAFIARGGRDLRPELARLPGVRLVTATEPAAGHAWDEKIVKAITGGDAIECRFLYGQPFTYEPQFKIAIVGNSEPEIRNVDDAMLRRIHIVPLNKKVPRERQVENLSRILVQREGPQILAWMLAGCRAWQAEGLTPPRAVLAKTTSYADDEDTLGQWLGEECETGADYEVTRRDLFQAWVVWCRLRGEDPGSIKTFRRKVDARHLGLTDKQVGDRRLRGFGGIRLRPVVEFGTEADLV